MKPDVPDIVISWSLLLLKELFEKGPMKDAELRASINLVPPNLTPYNEATYSRTLEYLVNSGKIHLDKLDDRWTLG